MGTEDTWKVTVRDLVTKNTSTQHFDAVVVANGHYSDPYVPDIPGIEQWNKAYPGAITHSKFYRRPGEYRDKVSLNPISHKTVILIFFFFFLKKK
jgi:cation diffusion facilitator CzcD-associated flavoprotein CzcO